MEYPNNIDIRIITFVEKKDSPKQKIERIRENCERYMVRKRAVSKKKKRVFFTQVVSLSVVISI